MPVSDKTLMLRDTTDGALDATENGAAVLTGALPGNGIMVRVYVPTKSGTTPTFDSKIEQSANGTSGWTTVGSYGANITDVGYYEYHIQEAVGPYLRHVATLGGTTPDFGLTTVGLTPGAIRMS